MSETNFSDFLEDIKETLNGDSHDNREGAISEGIANLKSKIKDVEVAGPEPKVPSAPQVTKVKNALSLADRAIDTYKTKINPAPTPIDSPTSLDDVAPKDIPSTIASRESMKAIARSLTGMRSSGNVGKPSPTGPNGTGNVSSGLGGYAADVAGLTLENSEVDSVPTEETIEEYQARIFETFGIGEVAEEEIEEEIIEEETTVDLIGIFEDALVESGASDWQSVDAVTRQVCLEYNITPKELNREFKAQHGAYPDKWIVENLEIEECGYFPLDEAALLHKIGIVYDVSFLFRGGTQRFKFFWPNAVRPTMEEMQKAVELFYPRARLLAFYPAANQGCNQMVVVPPMSENFQIYTQDDWVPLSEEDTETLELIAEEVGEPITSPILNDDGVYEVLVSDHDTGEEKLVTFGEGAAWTKKSGQNSEGGLNEKGRKSYERENPGSNLKRPQPEGGSRRDSYCARSKGQQKMHNIDCSKDPDKRICKARRKWNC